MTTPDRIEELVRRLHDDGRCTFVWGDGNTRPCARRLCIGAEAIRATIIATLELAANECQDCGGSADDVFDALTDLAESAKASGGG